MHSLNVFLQDVGSQKSVSCIVWENTLPSICILKRLPIYIYISRKTLRSLRPEIGEFAGRAGEDRAVEDRAGQGWAGGHIKSGRGQKAGQGMMGIVQYE